MGITIKQIAVESGLSWPAVSQILKSSGRFAPATRERVLAVAAKHNYRPNASARALRQQHSKLIGVVFRNAPDQPFTNMAAFEYLLGINQMFQTAEYDTVLVRAGDLLSGDSPEPRVFRERLVDGIIVVGSFPKPVVTRLTQLANRIIWVDGPVWDDTCCVRRDEVAAGRLAAEGLIGLGYRRICFLTRGALNSVHHSHFERETGARAAAEAAGIAFRTVSWPEHDYAEEFTAVQENIAFGDGLVAGSLPIARRLVMNASSLGQVPGHAFGLVCCDDSMDTGVHWRNLCRVAFDRYGLGETAATMMLNLLARPESPPASIRGTPAWVIGNTAWGPPTHGHDAHRNGMHESNNVDGTVPIANGL